MSTKYRNTSKGIYKILNTVTNDFYIGSTVQEFNTRWSQHRRELFNNIHANHYLQNAWNKYGKDNFVFIQHEVLNEITDINELRKREQYWLDTLNPAYNLSAVAAYGEMSEYGIYRLGYKKGLRCELISPEGIHHCAINLAWFGKEFNLLPGSLQGLCTGKMHMIKKWKGSVILEDGSTPYLHTTKKVRREKRYLITNPEGIEFCTTNLKQFCIDNNLHQGHLSSTASPNSLQKTYKGYSAKHISDIQNENIHRLKNTVYIFYIWDTKTDVMYLIGNVPNRDFITLFEFAKEFNLNAESIRTALNKPTPKNNYKHFVIHRSIAQLSSIELNQYYEMHKKFKIQKQRKCNFKYIMTSPENKIYHLEKDLKSFCVKHSLDSSCILKVARNVLPHHKQWKVKRVAL
jgi:group I intron endonuclease